MEGSRISDYFLTGGLRTPGISYEVANGKLSIVIDSKQLRPRVSISNNNIIQDGRQSH